MTTDRIALPRRAPLFSKLQELAHEAEERFTKPRRGFDNIGLAVGRGVPERECSYWCTPLNSKAFGGIAAAGAFVSFLCEDGDDCWDELPVVLSVPEAFDNANVVVGEHLCEFLSLGCSRGFFALEQFAHSRKKAMKVYSSPDWIAQTHDERCRGFELDEDEERILSFLRTELGLEPWRDMERRFETLQERYLARIRLSGTPE